VDPPAPADRSAGPTRGPRSQKPKSIGSLGHALDFRTIGKLGNALDFGTIGNLGNATRLVTIGHLGYDLVFVTIGNLGNGFLIAKIANAFSVGNRRRGRWGRKAYWSFRQDWQPLLSSPGATAITVIISITCQQKNFIVNDNLANSWELSL